MNPKTFISLITVLWAGCLFVGCGFNQRQESGHDENGVPLIEIPADITPTVDQLFPLSEVASDIEFVQLEVTDESMLREEIHNIQVSDSFILVDDLFSVCLYTRDGKFLRRIGNRGEGPKEYDFSLLLVLDETNQEIYIQTIKAIKVFGLDGQYKRTIPNTKLIDIYSNLEPAMYKWKEYIFLRDYIPLGFPRQDIWTWALTDSSFQIKKKYYNPEVIKRKDELNKQVGNLFGEPKWGEGSKNLKDFYAGDFTMSFGLSDAILKFDTTQLTFNALYNFHFEKKVPFEMAAQWGKLDDRVFDYYILCDYLLSKDYLYLLLNKGREGIVVRYNKKKGETDFDPYENKIVERKLEFADVVHRSFSEKSMLFRNDMSGGCPFRVDYKSENGKCLVDIMNIDEIEQNIDIEKLKDEQVKDESSKQRWLDLLNRLSEDEQIIAIATLK